MKWLIIGAAIIAVCVATDTKPDSKEKRQNSGLGYGHQQHRHRFGGGGGHGGHGASPGGGVSITAPGASQPTHVAYAQPGGGEGASSQPELPEEYYKIFSQLALQQAEDVRQQQVAEGMKRLLEEQGGHVEIKEVAHDEYMKSKGLNIVPQNDDDEGSKAPVRVLSAGQLPGQGGRSQPGYGSPQPHPPQASSVQYSPGVQDLTEEQLFQLLNSGEKTSGSPKPGPPQKLFYHNSGSSESVERQKQQQVASYYSSQQPHGRPKGGQRPLQDTSLESEIAKLEGSLISGYNKAVSQAHHTYAPQQHRQQYKPQTVKYNQYPLPAEDFSKFQAANQPQASALTADPPQLLQTHHHQPKETSKPQYGSDVQRFYHQAPTPLHQHSAEQKKVQYYTTEQPTYDRPEYVTANPVKVVEAPKLQYQNPHHHHQQQQHQHVAPPQQPHIIYKQQENEDRIPAVDVSQELFQKALGPSAQHAPSRSSIYVSQTTGAPPTYEHKKQYNKHSQQPTPPNYRHAVAHQHENTYNEELQQQQQQHQQQHHHHQQPQYQQQQQQHQPQSEVRLPPLNNGRPLTQEEFQALVDAGYSVTAVPVPVAVPAEEYYKNQKQHSPSSGHPSHKAQAPKHNEYAQQSSYKPAEPEYQGATAYHAYRNPYGSSHKHSPKQR